MNVTEDPTPITTRLARKTPEGRIAAHVALALACRGRMGA